MSTLTIADLDPVEELSPSRMREVAGGMSCGQAGNLALFYYGLGTVYGAMGLDQAGADANGKAKSLIKGSC